MRRFLFALTVVALAACLPVRQVSAAEPEAQKAPTFFRLLVGHPDPASGPSVLVVPGMVAAIGASDPATDVLKVIDELKATYRLGAIDILSSVLVPFTAGQTAEVVTVPGGPQISAAMVGFDDRTATLKVSLVENGKVLAEPVVQTLRGGRAVIGTRNGPAAPYVFLLVEPLRAPALKRAGGDAVAQGDLVFPKLMKKVQPLYPDGARKAKLEGLVVLDCTIGADGRVKGCSASRREPMGLTDAAIAAVAQWEFEPAREASGQAVEAVMTFTIRFALS